ncbi:MAG: hypothetical protein H7X80_08765 [bacterium]|nr:hypothetical protein [Candidatus Kapabacteria bacterium]
MTRRLRSRIFPAILTISCIGCSSQSLPTIPITTQPNRSFYVVSARATDFSEWRVDARLMTGIARLNGDAWVVVGDGGTVMRTTDAGENWQSVASSATAGLDDVCNDMVTGTGIAVGHAGATIRSTDGGQSWVSSEAVTSANLLEVSAYTGRAIAVGSTAMVRTSNGGVSWQSVPNSNNWVFRGVCMETRDRAYVVGDNGLVITTSDGGATWTELPKPDNIAFVDVTVPAPGVIVAVGTQVSSGSGVVARSTDGGATWSTNSLFEALTNVTSLDGIVWTTSTTKIHRSEDYGATWVARVWADPVSSISEIVGSSTDELVVTLYGSGFEH